MVVSNVAPKHLSIYLYQWPDEQHCFDTYRAKRHMPSLGPDRKLFPFQWWHQYHRENWKRGTVWTRTLEESPRRTRHRFLRRISMQTRWKFRIWRLHILVVWALHLKRTSGARNPLVPALFARLDGLKFTKNTLAWVHLNQQGGSESSNLWSFLGYPRVVPGVAFVFGFPVVHGQFPSRDSLLHAG